MCREPFSKAAFLDVLGHPRDVLVGVGESFLDLLDLHVPRRNGLVDERSVGTVAVRIGVDEGILIVEFSLFLESLDEKFVGFLDVHAFEVEVLFCEATVIVYRAGMSVDVGFLHHAIVIFPEVSGDVNKARTIVCGDVVVV